MGGGRAQVTQALCLCHEAFKSKLRHAERSLRYTMGIGAKKASPKWEKTL